MTNWVVLLRGINVGGKNKIKMSELRDRLEDRGVNDVRTYIQSGNVVFSSNEKASTIQTLVRSTIADGWGYDIPTVTLKSTDLIKVIQANPFCKRSTDFQHFTLLDKKPKAADVHAISKRHFGDEQFTIIGRCVYLYCPDGVAKSKLTVPLFEKHLKVVATNRNWRTLTKLAELSGTIS